MEMDLSNVLSEARGFGFVKNQFTSSFSNEVFYGLILDRMRVVQESDYPAYVRFDKASGKFVMNVNMQSLADLFNEVVLVGQLEQSVTDDSERERTLHDALVAFTRGIIKHEIMHVILKHMISIDMNIDHQLANVCQDSLVNKCIGEFDKLPVRFVTVEQYYNPELKLDGSALVMGSSELRDYTWEELYQSMLSKEGYQNSKEARDRMNQWTLDKINGSGEGQPTDNAGDAMLGDLPTDQGDQEVQDAMDQLLDDVMNEAGFSKTIGNMIGKELRRVLDNRKSQCNWKQLLRNQMGRRLSYDVDYTWMRPNRRFDDLQGKKKKYKSNVLVLIDVSGSIEEKQISQFTAEVNKIAKNAGGEVDVATYDADITGKYSYKEFKKLEGLTGNGGTSLNTAISTLGKELEQYDVVVVFTDGADNAITASRKIVSRFIVAIAGEAMDEFVDSIKNQGGSIVQIDM